MADRMRRVQALQRFVVTLSVVGLTSVGLLLVIWLRTRAWQMMVVVGAVLVAILLAVVAWLVARRERVTLAGTLVLVALLLIYVAGELAWSHATPYLMASGALLILFAGFTFLAPHWWSWLICLASLALSTLLINQFGPVPRFDIRRSPLLRSYVVVSSTLLSAAVVWRAVRAYQTVTTIRARLLVLSIATVLLTAVAISAGSIVIGFRNGRAQAIDRLEIIVSLREVEMDGWITNVKDALAASLQQAPEHRFVESDVANVVAKLLDMPADSQEYQDAYDFLSYNFEQWLKQAQAFEAVFFMDRDGKVLVSSDPAMEGQVLDDEAYFNRGTVGSFVAPPIYDDSLGRPILYTSRPILGEYGSLLGVLAGRVDASTLDRLMHLREQTSLAETGETYLVNEDHRMLTASRFGEAGQTVETEAVRAALERGEGGTGTYLNYQGDSVIGVYRWLPDLKVVLVAEQNRAEALRAVNRTAVLNASIAVVAVLVAGALSLSIAQSIGGPLSNLAQVASDIAAGNLERTARVERQDEIGTLAEAFNTMTTRLRGLIGRLEQRVAERTRELETRSAYLEASAEVGRAVSTMLDVDTLVQDVVDLVRDRFDLYYVGLFLLDEMGEWAELQAGTGEAGQQMVARAHKLVVGGDSMIGQCVAHGEARIALDVGAEAVRFDNPLLPRTRSEAALPLQSRGRMFGAITIQSEEPAAFDEDTVTVLETMADQVAVALDNAYLFTEAQSALAAARRASGEVSRQAWSELLGAETLVGYHCDDRGVLSAEGIWRPEMEQAVRERRVVRVEDDDHSGADGARQPLAVPITVAGKVIAVLHTYKPQTSGPWTDEEIDTLESVAERMGVSLESARLYRETQRRAERERLSAEISSQVWGSTDVDTILRTAVRQLGRSLRVSDAWIELGSGNGEEASGGAERGADARRKPSGGTGNGALQEAPTGRRSDPRGAGE